MKRTTKKLLEEIIKGDLHEVKSLTGKERQEKVCEIEKLYKLETERNKNEDELVEKYVQVFAVPMLGFGMLLTYRILMETECAPDIFFRDCGKTIMNLVSFKKF